MALKLDDLIQGKNGESDVDVGGITVPAKALAALREMSYEHLKLYLSEKTISAWGKTCSGCFTQAQLRRMAQ
jgi:hypothetical protein